MNFKSLLHRFKKWTIGKEEDIIVIITGMLVATLVTSLMYSVKF